MPWQGELADYNPQYGGSGIAGPRRILRKRAEKDEIAPVLRANVNFNARVLQDTFQDGSHHLQHLGKTDDVGHHVPAGSSGSPSTSSRTQHLRGNSNSRGSSRESEFRSEDNSGFVVSDRYVESAPDIQKLDEWLEVFDGDIKNMEDYEFVVRLDGEVDPSLSDQFDSTAIARSTAGGPDHPLPSVPSSARGNPGGDGMVVEDLLASCTDSTPSVSFGRGSNLKDFAVVRSVCGDEAEFALTETDGQNGALTDAAQLNSDMVHHPLGQLNFAETNNMDIMLMTPQELERMPESGIEFDESVGPKESEPPLPTDVLEAALQDTGDRLPEEEPMETGELVSEQDRLLLELDETVPEQGNGSGLVSCLAEPEMAYVDESATLATISISTDADSNTTSIIINTEQGQKSFRVNTNNLMQAAATMQPITLADLVNEQGITVLGGDDEVEQAQQQQDEGEMKDQAEQLQEADLEYSTETVMYPKANCRHEEKCTGTVCTHTGRCKMTWTCPEPHCGKTYTKQCKLKVHMMSHTGIRPHKCTVEGCDWSFTTVYKLKRHLETHGGSKDFVCDFDGCNSKFTTIYNLKSHMKLHTQPNAVPCSIEYCNRRFPNRRKMELHLREHEEVEAPYTCTEEKCGKKYYTANSMASHLRCHQKTSFPCTFDNCGMVFDKFSRLKTHLWRHTGERPYVCTYEGCGWAFPSASKRKRHMQKHTGERQYTCSVSGCGKSFRRLEHMQGHAITHSGEKPFACPHPNCEAHFTARSSLYVHIKKHAGGDEKQVYPCPVENCTKKYNCKSSLRMHLLKYHTPILAETSEYLTWFSGEEYQDCGDGQVADGVVLQAAAGEMVPVDGECDIVYENGAEEIKLEYATDDDAEDCPVVNSDADAITTVVATAVSTDVPLHVGAQMVVTQLPDMPDVSMDLLAGLPEAPLEEPTLAESHNVAAMPSTSGTMMNDLRSLSSSRVLQQNHSGSARTDFCSNHKTMEGMRRRKQLLEERGNVEVMLSTPEVARQRGRQLKINNVQSVESDVDGIRAAASQYSCMPQSQLLQDDPPSHGDQFYQDDGLLTSMANDLAVPISLLSEVSVVDPSSTVSEFTGTTINLQDLK